MNVDAIPVELRERRQWVLWKSKRREGKPTKIPYQADRPTARASSTDASTWATFEAALAAADAADGIGFVFSADDPYVGVDLDDFDTNAAAIVSSLRSYTERSVSGRGAHVIVRASLNGTPRRRKGPVEIYADGRYFVVTGDHVQGTPATIEPRQAELEQVVEHVFGRSAGVEPPLRPAPPPLDLDDEDLLELARKARNGADFERLWTGGTAGYDSHSEADLALCGMLAFYCGPDAARIDRLFRRSGLMREKWDSRRGETTYGSETIARSLEGRTEFYERRRTRSQPASEPRDDDIDLTPDSEANESNPHSWRPASLVRRALEPQAPPEIGGVLYPGKRHLFTGEYESGKSLFAHWIETEQIRSGEHVVHVDFEQGASETLARLQALGLADEEIDTYFHYIEPEEAIDADARILADLAQMLGDLRAPLVVFDAFAGLASLHRIKENEREGIELLYRQAIRPFTSRGCAAVSLDHVVKDPDKRGKYAISSERKTGIVEVHLRFEAVQPLARGRTGIVRITTHKDRAAFLPRPRLGDFIVESDASGAMTCRLTKMTPQAAESADGFRPTVLMERVSVFLELKPEPVSRNSVETGVKGNIEYLRLALDLLVQEEYVLEESGARGARLYSSIKPYREGEEAQA